MSCEDLPKYSEEWERRARKIHRCEECPEPIKPGSTYIEITGVWDASWSRYRFHPRCLELLKTVGADECGCYVFGGLKDSMEFRDGEWRERKDLLRLMQFTNRPVEADSGTEFFNLGEVKPCDT